MALGFSAAAVILCFVLGNVQTPPTPGSPTAMGTLTRLDGSLDHASLSHLYRTQYPDGSWGNAGLAQEASVALTALAAMAIARKAPTSDSQATRALQAAAEWLIARQNGVGVIAQSANHRELQHSVATSALIEIRRRHAWEGLDPLIAHAVSGSAGTEHHTRVFHEFRADISGCLGPLGSVALRLLEDV
jgi:hypothetical protein